MCISDVTSRTLCKFLLGIVCFALSVLLMCAAEQLLAEPVTIDQVSVATARRYGMDVARLTEAAKELWPLDSPQSGPWLSALHTLVIGFFSVTSWFFLWSICSSPKHSPTDGFNAAQVGLYNARTALIKTPRTSPMKETAHGYPVVGHSL